MRAASRIVLRKTYRLHVTTPERFDPRKSVLTGLDVLDHGLPEPPGVLTHTMSVPMAFWTTANCAVVLFLRYSEQPDEPPMPAATMGTYYRDGGRWRAHRYRVGTGWSHDPIASPGATRDLGDRALVVVGGGLTDRPRPGQAAVIRAGRASPAVTALAVIQDGLEDRRPLRSHFRAWVVCLERWSPYQINALDHAGAVIGSTQGPPTLPSQRTAG